MSDPLDSVVAAAAAGESWAFERLYRTLAPRVSGYLRVQGCTEPEDLTNEVFLGVFRGMKSFCGGDRQFRSWVFSIAHRRLIDERRRWNRRPKLAAADSPDGTTVGAPAGDVEDDVMRVLATQRVLELCDGLSRDQRDILLLRTAADLTVAQVAYTLGKSEASVKALQRRGLAALKQRLEREAATL